MNLNSTLFGGTWQKVLIKVIMLLLVLFVMYKIFNKIKWKPTKTENEVNDYINNELPNDPPVDNSSTSDPETISDAESELIANNLQVYMEGFGTNEESLFSALQCLNGASLNKVYASFGARDYDGTMMDLYGWFSEELSNLIFSSGVFYNECNPECDSWWSNCYAMTYMRLIWSKSSIPVSF